MKNTNLILMTCILMSVLNFGISSNAEETQLEKAETVKNKTTDQVKSSYRNLKDKTCEMIDGKMNCVVKKLKHKVQGFKDNSHTDAKEVLNKVD